MGLTRPGGGSTLPTPFLLRTLCAGGPRILRAVHLSRTKVPVESVVAQEGSSQLQGCGGRAGQVRSSSPAGNNCLDEGPSPCLPRPGPHRHQGQEVPLRQGDTHSCAPHPAQQLALALNIHPFTLGARSKSICTWPVGCTPSRGSVQDASPPSLHFLWDLTRKV